MIKNELVQLYNLPDDADVIPRKTFVGCGIAFADI